MFKTSELYNQFHYQTSDILTPIRDYKNDFFHAHDDNLPKFEKWQIGKLGTIKRLQGETNENSINDINNMDDNCLDDIDDSSSEKMSEASMETTPGQLHNIIKMFYESEIEYLENLGLINSVYRARLKGRRMPKSKRNLKLKSQEELLLFGNIDTITSISVIFVNMLKDLWNSDKYWKTRTDTDDIHSSGVINEMQTIFEQHLGRCRSTYIHYTIAHSRQMALYESVSIRKHFGGWFEDCMKHARFISLRDLLRYPIIRIDSWLQVLDDIVDACDEFSDITKYSGLIDVQQKYLNFKGILTDELQEYGTNTSLDCALSPGDIIDNYHSMSESEYNFTMSEVSDVKPLSYRPSSSRYEEQSSTASIEQKGGNSFHDNLVIKEQIACDITFADHIVQFTKMHQGVARLKVLVSQMNLLTIPDNDINLLLRWKKVVDTGGRTSDTVCIDGSKLTNLDQHAQDLNKLKEKLTILRLTDMESNVLMPLVAMLQKCQAVKHQLRDLKTLERTTYST